MAAPLGYKDFTTGEVLTANDVDGYLMQGIWVFASAAARDAAVTSPQEGNFAFLKDTNVTTYYTGSAWANLDTTGMVNPMTTTGDTIYSSSGSTPARLGIGTTGQVLTVAGGIPSWATPTAAASGLTLISRQTFSNTAAINFENVFTSTYESYVIVIERIYGATSGNDAILQMLYSTNTVQATAYYGGTLSNLYNSASAIGAGMNNVSGIIMDDFVGGSVDPSNYSIYISQVGNGSRQPAIWGNGVSAGNGSTTTFGGYPAVSRVYTGFRLISSSSNITGEAAIYGMAK